MDNGLSLADAMALKDDNGMNGNCWIWIIVLFLFMWGGGDYFNRGSKKDCASTEDVQNQFNFSALERQNNEIISAVKESQYETGTTIRDAAFTNLSELKGIEASLAQLGYLQQSCCCETNRNIDSLKAENYKNTCEITTAIHAEGEATRALINANTMQELRDKLQNAQYQLDNIHQTQQLVGTLRPFPTPAYITCSPYTSAQNVCCGC